MSVIVLSPGNASLLNLEVRVEDDEWVNKYTRLELWRSILGEAGPYEPLTSSLWTEAGVLSNISGNVNIVGKELKVLVDDVELRHTFTGVDPLSISTVVSQLSVAWQGAVQAYELVGSISLHNRRRVGGLSRIQVLESEAAGVLGFTYDGPLAVAYGTDPHNALVLGTNKYTFTDYYSETSYYYKTRFSNHVTGARSPLSDAIAATQRLGVDPSKVVTGYVNLLQADGRPAAKQVVLLYSAFNGNRLAEGMVVGGPSKAITDSDGYAEFTLLRGITVDIGLDGSGFIRRVTTPTDTSVLSFDMFDPQYGEDDNLSVQRAELPYAERTTL